MYLLISVENTGTHQFASFLQCGMCGFASPWEWAKVVAAQQDSFCRETRALGRAADPIREILRRLARVATKLVHLAGCRFHMQNRTILDCLLDRCFEDLRVGRTDGVRHRLVPTPGFAAKHPETARLNRRFDRSSLSDSHSASRAGAASEPCHHGGPLCSTKAGYSASR